ncbi:MerR family transcriptional regulator [Sedimentitalea arenosa]|uniref:MerR family transcriptional regulator n=1 Tax=Sedimentitalea arenosa TaxID=2798803 RepID=A0A8J7J9D4_9RHOB|nr:MerR family transcriptional regulator [Arenibacterium arenosum]MBJ6373192.1 MerR family transcriptional regulator [Arenibacterium arenosum]
MTKSPDAFRTISEVAEWLGVQAHVLRFWESKFSQVKPVKRAGGRRYYRPSDMQLLGGIKKLLHDDGLTIKGVQKILREHGVGHVVALSPALEDGTESAVGTGAEPPVRDATVLNFRSAASTTADDEDEDDDEFPVQQTMPLPELDPDDEDFDDDDREDSEPDEDLTDIPQQQDDPVTAAPDMAPPNTPLPQGPLPVSADAMPETVARPLSEPDIAPQATPAPEQAPTPATAPPKQPEQAPSLPSFMHRGGMARSEAKPDTTAPPPAPETEKPPARVIDAPDPPAESDLPATPGLLSRLARTDRLSPDEAAELAPIARELRAWLDRASASGIA